MELVNEIEVKAFVTNLGKYNEGELVGEWVTFPIDDDEKEELFKRIGISDEPDEEGNYYEEYFMTDYESELPLYSNYGEYVNIDTLNDIAEGIEGLRPYEQKKLMAILDGVTSNIEDAFTYLNDYELFANMSGEEYEEEMMKDGLTENEYNLLFGVGWLSSYITIDFKQMAKDDDYLTETLYGVLISH